METGARYVGDPSKLLVFEKKELVKTDHCLKLIRICVKSGIICETWESYLKSSRMGAIKKFGGYVHMAMNGNQP